MAARRGRGEPGRQNAVRHFVWQALITARLGLPVARAVAEAQETGTPNAADSQVDRHNNAVGQEYGAAHADELAGGSVNAALGRPGRRRAGEVGAPTSCSGSTTAEQRRAPAPIPVATSAKLVDSGDSPIRRPPGSR